MMSVAAKVWKGPLQPFVPPAVAGSCLPGSGYDLNPTSSGVGRLARRNALPEYRQRRDANAKTRQSED